MGRVEAVRRVDRAAPGDADFPDNLANKRTADDMVPANFDPAKI
jgi:hypothetical protein